MLNNRLITELSLLAGAAVMLTLALLLGLAMTPAHGAQPAPRDQRTRAHIESLAGTERRELQQALRDSLIRTTGKENLAAIPVHQIYHAIFLDLLIKPSLAVQLPPMDRALIASLPTPASSHFAAGTRNALSSACREVNRLSPGNPAAARMAARAFVQARRQLGRLLDKHYERAVESLSERGRAVVAEQLAELGDSDMLVHTELDLESLGFNAPDFVVMFLQDACENSGPLIAREMSADTTLGDQLLRDFDNGAVQIFSNP